MKHMFRPLRAVAVSLALASAFAVASSAEDRGTPAPCPQPPGTCITEQPGGGCTSASCTPGAKDCEQQAVCTPSIPDFHFTNRWHVVYSDSRIGKVEGTAYVNWEAEQDVGQSTDETGRSPNPSEVTGFARVVMKDPKSGKEQQLVAHRISFLGRDKNVLQMVLEGASPAPPAVMPPDSSGMMRLAADDGQTISIRLRQFSAKISVRAKAMAELSKVTVMLRPGPFGELNGSWTYYADPLTERDRSGQNRAGAYHLLNKAELDEMNNPPAGSDDTPISGYFLGRQSGEESWWPEPTQIDSAMVVEDQLAHVPGLASVPLFGSPYPDGLKWDGSGIAYHWPGNEARYRTLLIVGRNLPMDKGKAIATIKPGKGVSVLSLLATSQDDTISPDNQKTIAQGFDRIVADLNAKGQKVTRDDVSKGMEFALFKVKLDDDVTPGPKTLIWGGAGQDWLLQFGDNTVDMRFVRQVPDSAGQGATVTEASEEFFLPEQVAVEVDTRLALPKLDSIPVLFAYTGSKATALTATRVPGHGSLYRTNFMAVGGGGGANVKSGGKIFASVDQHELLDKQKLQFVSIPFVNASVTLTPASNKPGQVGLWSEALLRAGAAAKIAINSDNMATIAGHGETTIDKIPVTVGNHAAMLLLRDTFADLMQQQLDWLNGLQLDRDMEKFRDWVKPYVLYDGGAFYGEPQMPGGGGNDSYYQISKTVSFDPALKAIDDLDQQLADVALLFKGIPGLILGGPQPHRSAFAQIQVSGLDGGTATLYDTFVQEDSAKQADPEKLRKWRIDTARQALQKYQQVVEQSLAHAKEIRDTDLKELLKLTGAGFGPVVKRLVPRLMTLRDTGANSAARSYLWVPDRLARTEVLRLDQTAKAARAQEDYSDAKTQFCVMAATSALALPVIVSEGALASIVSLAGNILVWEVNSVQEVLSTYKSYQDVQFEFGNAAVLGPERLAEAEVKKTPWYETLVSIGAQGALVGLQAKFDTLPKISREMAIYRAEQLLPKLSGPDAAKIFRTLAAEDQNNLLLAMQRAAIRSENVAALSLEEADALMEGKAIAKEAAPGNKTVAFQDDLAKGANDTIVLHDDLAEAPPGVSDPTEAATNVALEDEFEWVGGDPPRVNEPAENSMTIVKIGEGERRFTLGRSFGGGASSQVFEVLEVNGQRVSQPTVIKFAKYSQEMGTQAEQLQRMWQANSELLATRNGKHAIEFAEILEIHPEADRPFLLQKLVEGPDVSFVKARDLLQRIVEIGPGIGVPKSFKEVSNLFPREMQRAVARLYRDIAENGLMSTDLSLPNLYFKKAGDEWVAGILDVDHVVNVRKPDPNSVTWKWIWRIMGKPEAETRQITSIAFDGRRMDTPSRFMEKMLEHTYGGHHMTAFITFDDATKTLVPQLMDPTVIQEFFPDFKTMPAPAVPARAPGRQGWLFKPQEPPHFANDNAMVRIRKAA